MRDVIETLHAELAGLEAELSADVRYLKAQRIRELLALYEDRPETPVQAKAQPTKGVKSPRGQTLNGFWANKSERDSKKRQIRAKVEQLLTERPVVHRGELLEALKAANLMGHEKNPMASLAAYLSEWRDQFTPDGRGNFMLASRAANGATPDPITSPDSDAGNEIGQRLSPL